MREFWDTIKEEPSITCIVLAPMDRRNLSQWPLFTTKRLLQKHMYQGTHLAKSLIFNCITEMSLYSWALKINSSAPVWWWPYRETVGYSGDIHTKLLLQYLSKYRWHYTHREAWYTAKRITSPFIHTTVITCHWLSEMTVVMTEKSFSSEITN